MLGIQLILQPKLYKLTWYPKWWIPHQQLNDLVNFKILMISLMLNANADIYFNC